MSKFVNYKKRSVALPLGCKNLIDVLQPHKNSKLLTSIDTSAAPPEQQIAVTRDESATGRLADTEKYVSMVFESRAWSFMLTISRSEEQFTLQVDRAPASSFRATRTRRKRFAHSLLVVACIYLTIGPPQFVPAVPWQITYEIAPCPSHSAQLSNVLLNLCREALGLNDESQLCLELHEITRAS